MSRVTNKKEFDDLIARIKKGNEESVLLQMKRIKEKESKTTKKSKEDERRNENRFVRPNRVNRRGKND